MKLPSRTDCQFSARGGNRGFGPSEKRTMIVEGQGIGFWTRVRLPSGPANGPYPNCAAGVWNQEDISEMGYILFSMVFSVVKT